MENNYRNKLVIVTGLPGSGKTIVSRIISQFIGGKILRTDVIRKELYTVSKYTLEERDAVYNEFFLRTENGLKAGDNIIMDAVFAKKSERQIAIDIALTNNIPYYVIYVSADESIIKERLESRNDDESEANFEVYLKIKQRYESLDIPFVTIENSGSIEELKEKIINLEFVK